MYLPRAFVLSWSLLEAITQNETVKRVDFLDTKALAQAMCDLLDNPPMRPKLRANARTFAQRNHDLLTVSLPKQLRLAQTEFDLTQRLDDPSDDRHIERSRLQRALGDDRTKVIQSH